MATWYRNGIAQETTENYGDIVVIGGMDIDSGTLVVDEVTNTVTITGDTIYNGDTTITGDAVVTGDVTGASFTGPVTGNLTGNVTGATWTGDLAISGDLTVNGNDIIMGGFDEPTVGTAVIGLQRDVIVHSDPSTLHIISQNLHDPASGGHNTLHFDLTLESDGYTTLKSINNKSGGVKIVHDPYTTGVVTSANAHVWIDANGFGTSEGHIIIGQDGKTDSMAFVNSTPVTFNEDTHMGATGTNIELSLIPLGSGTGLQIKDIHQNYHTHLIIGSAAGGSSILDLEGGTITTNTYDALINFKTGDVARGSLGYDHTDAYFYLTDALDLGGNKLLSVAQADGRTTILGDLQIDGNTIASGGGTAAIELSGAHVACYGNLTVEGNMYLKNAGKGIIFEGTTADSYEITLLALDPIVAADIAISLPAEACTLVGDTVTQILANKSFGAVALNGAVTGSFVSDDLMTAAINEIPTAVATRTYANGQLRTATFVCTAYNTGAGYHYPLLCSGNGGTYVDYSIPPNMGNGATPTLGAGINLNWSTIGTTAESLTWFKTMWEVPFNATIASVRATVTTSGATSETVRFHVVKYDRGVLTEAGDLKDGVLKAQSTDIAGFNEDVIMSVDMTLGGDVTLTQGDIVLVFVEADDATDYLVANVTLNYHTR